MNALKSLSARTYIAIGALSTALIAAICVWVWAGTPVTLTGPVYQNNSTVSPLGELRVENPASQLFLDTFGTAAIDTINRWTLSNGGGGVLPAPVTGAVTLSGGTATNGFSKMVSLIVPTLPGGVAIGNFAPAEPGFLLFNSRVNLPNLTTTSATIDFGLGTSPTTPTNAAPITQCVCFEVTTAGKLQAVTYQTGTRVLINDLSIAPVTGGSAPQPALTDITAHKYFIYFRGDIAYWAIDDKDNVVASYQTGASGPDVNVLPVLFQVISSSATAPVLQVNAVSVGDTSHTGTTQNLFNGFTFEPQRSNTDSNTAVGTLTAQGAGTVNTSDFINVNGRGVIIGINTTVDSAGAYVVNIQGKDIPSGTYYTLASSASITAAGFVALQMYPGLTATANIFNAPLPRTWRIQAVVTTGPITATIGASVIN